MKKFICLIFAAALFNGCFDLYIYLIPQKDSTYIISQRASMGLSVMQALLSFGSMDSTGQPTLKDMPSPKAMMDSILASDAKKEYEFQSLSGYLGHTMRDSLFDTTAFFIQDIHVKDADVIPSFMKALQSDTNSSTDLRVILTVEHPKGRTQFSFHAQRIQSSKDSNASSFDLARIESGGYHIGVVADNLIPLESNSSVRTFQGGAEWFIPFKSLSTWEHVKTKKVDFILMK